MTGMVRAVLAAGVFVIVGPGVRLRCVVDGGAFGANPRDVFRGSIADPILGVVIQRWRNEFCSFVCSSIASRCSSSGRREISNPPNPGRLSEAVEVDRHGLDLIVR
jgi:hypothetical protein